MSDQQTIAPAPWPAHLVAILSSSWRQMRNCRGCAEPVTWGQQPGGKWTLFDADPRIVEARVHPGMGVRIDLVDRSQVHFSHCTGQSRLTGRARGGARR